MGDGANVFERLQQVVEMGGPVVMVLLVVAVLALSVAVYKVWQFWASAVGRHKALKEAVIAWDSGNTEAAQASLARSTSYLVPVVRMAMDAPEQPAERLQAEAEGEFSKLERGFRFLDSVAQLAPLLGLFGTVLGMIEAFQAMQGAGAQVDPSILAGGIWVALLTTAVGLAIAMPTALVLSWLEQRMEDERVIADRALLTILHPQAARAPAAPELAQAHG